MKAIEITEIIGVLLMILVVPIVAIAIAFFLLFTKVSFNEQVVSGVVYNTSNNQFISGNTKFSIRASENTYVSEENKSSYCLPKESPYIALVNEAATNKDTKVKVTTTKAFQVVPAPWVCIENVKVEKIKE